MTAVLDEPDRTAKAIAALHARDSLKIKCLKKLLAHGEHAAVELESDYQKAVWAELATMGYARISDNAICGFERLRGTFVSITEAGRRLVEEA